MAHSTQGSAKAATDKTHISKYNLGSDSIAKINESLFLSSLAPAENHGLLHDLGITHILNLTGYVKGSKTELRSPPKYPQEFAYKHIVIADENTVEATSSLGKAFIEPGHQFILEALKDNNSRVLVHCDGGISRSSTMVISYLMVSENKTLKEAYVQAQKAKPNIAPNDGFFTQLREFEIKLAKEKCIMEMYVNQPSYPLVDYLTDQLESGIARGLPRETIIQALKRHERKNRGFDVNAASNGLAALLYGD